jgi:hypothetical protein
MGASPVGRRTILGAPLLSTARRRPIDPAGAQKKTRQPLSRLPRLYEARELANELTELAGLEQLRARALAACERYVEPVLQFGVRTAHSERVLEAVRTRRIGS